MSNSVVRKRRSLVTAALLAPLAVSADSVASGVPSDCSKEIMRIVSEYAAAWHRGDPAALFAHYHDNFTLHYPGHHALAGTHIGKPAALRVLREVSARTNRKLLSVLDVMGGAHRGALNVTEEWTRDGETCVVERVFVYAVQDGKLAQCWLFDADQRVVERFLNAV